MLNRKSTTPIYDKLDYVRIATFEFVSDEIISNKVLGNIAELGVYKGSFASIMNRKFKDKQLYLFDTFSGFDERDVVNENKKFSSKYNDFSNTNVEKVLEKMEYKNNCIVKKGYFPESLNGLEDTFCFVSIDADLYDPIYSGLNYFYPRLNKGGYIFIHDYNNINYPGAKEAVKRFCKENSINFVPICDGWGTAIITK